MSKKGGRWTITAEDLVAFLDGPNQEDAPATTPRTSSARRKAIEQAERELERFGI
jgi:hypothetical protein